MTTYPLTTLSCTITTAGISAPAYSDILASLIASFQGIYGSDVYLEPDSQDGQFLAILAKAINDNNNACIAAYNSFSPATAIGNGLSSNVKINGLKRGVPTVSTATVTVGGTSGFQITNGLIGDDQNLGTQWTLPAVITIGSGGTVSVLATCTAPGAQAAAPGTLTKILTPQLGWQTVTNPAAAVTGNPVEIDAALRQRQSKSTGLPAQSILDAIVAAIENVPGVLQVKGYQNNTGSTDANGLVAHSMAFVVQGGNPVVIAQTIASKKNPGPGMNGTTSEVIVDPQGISDTIAFYVMGTTQLDIAVSITALAGYVSTTTPLIQAALSQSITNLDIGDDSLYGWLWAPASLQGDDAVEGVSAALGQVIDQAYLDVLRKTFKVTAIGQCLHGGTPTAADVAIAFNNSANVSVGNITVTVS